jgi:Transposase
MTQHNASVARTTVGLDVGDRYSYCCTLDSAGEIVEQGRVATTPRALRLRFEHAPRQRVVLETGTHSPWVSCLVAECGHEVIVANARRLRLIYATDTKSDRVDAETLARVGRMDPALLAPIQHRGAAAQTDLAILRAARRAGSGADATGQSWARRREIRGRAAAQVFDAQPLASGAGGHPGGAPLGARPGARED